MVSARGGGGAVGAIIMVEVWAEAIVAAPAIARAAMAPAQKIRFGPRMTVRRLGALQWIGLLAGACVWAAVHIAGLAIDDAQCGVGGAWGISHDLWEGLATGTAAAGSAPIIWLKNDAPIQSKSVGNAIDIRFSPDKTGTVSSPNAYIRVQENGGKNGTSMQFATMAGGASSSSERMRITASGLVGIGTVIPGSTLEVDSKSSSLNGGAINGGSAVSGTMGGGSTGLVATGGDGDLSIDASGNGGDGLHAQGGESTSIPGTASFQRATISRETVRLAEASPRMLESMCSSFITVSWLGLR